MTRGAPIKTLVVALGIAIAVLTVAGTTQAALVNITVDDDFYDPADAVFEFPATPDARWDWGGIGGSTTNQHTVTQNRGLFNSGNPKTTGTFEVSASSGKYPYHCEIHGQAMTGTLSIQTAFYDVDDDSVRVRWATDSTTTGNRFDVRYRVDGGTWKSWLRRTRKKTKVFGNNNRPIKFNPAAHDYELSARSHKGKPAKKKRSGFSPAALVP